MSVCSVCLTLGILTGYLVSNEIYEKVHHNTYYILYGVSICSCVLILMYTAFLLPENKVHIFDVKESYPRIINKSFFNISHIKKSVEVLFENRPSKGRTVLMLLTFIIVIDILVFQGKKIFSSLLLFFITGEGNFRYLSLKATFSWSAEDYNIFSAILSGSAVVTSLIGVWLLKKVLDLNEPFMIFLIVMLSLTSSILVSISKTTTDIYCSALLGCFVVLLSPLVKSEVSYLVPNSDIGKIFALTSTLEAITPFAATPIYTEVYNLVISSKPLYVNFVSAGFWLIATILAL
ncbi:hypothetical protein O3M35_008111 [Rhynocoris fuscipes]|uniref:Uncharacterized protein n=1 Tax=Rhynocoris fuscipes TaxID=488301 RepID=A0AAW1D534_9HEMI